MLRLLGLDVPIESKNGLNTTIDVAILSIDTKGLGGFRGFIFFKIHIRIDKFYDGQ
jgi:hypothetical protein